VDGKQVEVHKPDDEITIAYNSDPDHDEIPQKASLASISCVQQNRNEENELQREIITPRKKNQIQQSIAKYIPPHLKKDKIQSPSKEESKTIVSLATMTGKPQPKTLKLKGVIKDRNITILVDSGSTHNCIDIVVAKQLNLFVYPTKDLTIKVLMEKRSKKLEDVRRDNNPLKYAQISLRNLGSTSRVRSHTKRNLDSQATKKKNLSQDTAKPTQQFLESKTLHSKFWNQTLTEQVLEPNPHTAKTGNKDSSL
jgi:hypothetical protein